MVPRAELLLASSSPRRQQLLSLGNWAYSVMTAVVDESRIEGELPDRYVLRLAEAKARAAHTSLKSIRPDSSVRPDDKPQQDLSRSSVVLGADTVVVDDGEILGKPRDAQQATEMLRRLRGHPHLVLTGIALHKIENSGHLPDPPASAQLVSETHVHNQSTTELCITEVPMRGYTDQEIDSYVRSGDPLDKAGAYAIQHPGFNPVESMQGCYASVMGLPLCHLVRALRNMDVSVEPAAQECQKFLDYKCPVWDGILNGLN